MTEIKKKFYLSLRK